MINLDRFGGVTEPEDGVYFMTNEQMAESKEADRLSIVVMLSLPHIGHFIAHHSTCWYEQECGSASPSVRYLHALFPRSLQARTKPGR